MEKQLIAKKIEGEVDVGDDVLVVDDGKKNSHASQVKTSSSF